MERPLTEYIQRKDMPRLPSLCHDVEEVTMILDEVEIANGDEIPEWLGAHGAGFSGSTKLKITVEGTAAASGNQLRRASCAQLDT